MTGTNVVVVGPSKGIVEAFENEGASVEGINGVATRDRLEAVRIEEADVLVLTDVGEASAVPVARKLTDDLRVVIYSPETMPEFVRATVDLAVDPELMEPDVVAEELVAG